ncbi:MAG: lipocalin-like domain-containing protein [Bacteroidaceae bacterium]|nr:lipocalin-like domain-containing protein [Bacteroidaceae bacterium]
MKRQIYKSLALLIIILISSCESYQIHGDLDGFWQVTSIENKLTGEITHCKGDTYYSFQREMVLISYVSPNIPTGQMKENYIAYFTHENDVITMTDFRIYIDREGKQAPLSKLEKFGLYETFNTFDVEKLNNGSLILNSDKARIVLTKN